jgi:hypothetical protein
MERWRPGYDDILPDYDRPSFLLGFQYAENLSFVKIPGLVHYSVKGDSQLDWDS